MPVMIDQQVEARPGEDIFLGSASPTGQGTVVFEDNGETAYFYACQPDGPILDALHIYNVGDVADASRPSLYKVGWSPDGRHALLLINGNPHAVFDFPRKQGWCLGGFPPSKGAWSRAGHDWDEACLAPFR